jgi:Domain of unknown function (DUF3883)
MSTLKSFIESELEYRRRNYADRPTDMLRDYNIEQEKIQSYNGRQFFEMLQNADDAAEGVSNPKAYIQLIGNELLICNTGKPFSVEGMQSILNSNLSPKKGKADKIGQKGLGFRSILSWAEEVSIISGGLAVTFSQRAASTFLNSLAAEAPTVKDFLEKHKHISSCPIAVLTVPTINTAPASGYATVVKIILNSDVLEDVRKQMYHSISANTLLFLNHLNEIEVKTPEHHFQIKKVIHINGIHVLNIDKVDPSSSTQTWKVNQRSGVRNGKDGKPKAWELKVAWTADLSDTENVLYTYFRTEARFPFPGLVHGTFELNDNRNQLVRDTDGHNVFLCITLADLMAETAEKIAASNPEDPWLPLRFLNLRFSLMDNLLQEFGFETMLLAKIKERKVFPTVNKKYNSHRELPVFYKEPIAELLVGSDVENLMPVCKDLGFVHFLEKIGINYYIISKFIDIITARQATIGFDNYARLIHHLLTYEHYKNEKDKNVFDKPFLMDDKGGFVSPRQNIFILPEGQSRHYQLPEAVDIHFLHPKLVESLAGAFSTSTEDLPKKMEMLGVRTYSFATIVKMISDHFVKQERTVENVQNFHRTMYPIFLDELKQGGEISHVPAVLFFVLDREDNITISQGVYLGQFNGHDISEKLLRSQPSALLGRADRMGVADSNRSNVRRYFEWMDVKKLPTPFTTYLKRDSPDFLPYIESVAFDYGIDLGGLGMERFHRLWEQNATVKVFTYSHLDLILESLDPLTLLEWIHCDPLLRQILEDDKESVRPIGIHSDSLMQIFISGAINRHIAANQMRSFIRWKIARAAWVPATGLTNCVAPNSCCTSYTIGSELSPWVNKPYLDIEKLADQLKVKKETVAHYLEIAGVHRDISSYSIGQIYSILKILPEQDPEGKIAPRFYREVAALYKENRIDKKHPSYQDFVKNGLVLCRYEKRLMYVPVQDARYLSNRGVYGASVTRQFPLLVLESKKGTKQVETMFGVKHLEPLKYEINDPVFHTLQDDFEQDWEQFKVLAYALKVDQDTDNSVVNDLKETKVFIITEAKTAFIKENNRSEFLMEDYTFVWLPKSRGRQEFYIKVPPATEDLDQLRRSIIFCESISEIFGMMFKTDEYLSKLKSTYARVPSDREDWLISEIGADDQVLINHAAERLGVFKEKRFLLWEAMMKAAVTSEKSKPIISNDAELSLLIKNIPELPEFLKEYFTRKEVYEDMEGIQFLESFYPVFALIGADGEKFSRYFPDIEFSLYFRQGFANLRARYKAEFTQKLFEYYKKSTDIKLQESFVENLKSFDNLRYDTRFGFLANVEDSFRTKVEEAFQIILTGEVAIFNYEDTYKENLLAFQAESGYDLSQKLKSQKNITAWLLFGHWDKIRASIEQEKLRKDEEEQLRERYGLTGNPETEMAEIYATVSEELKNKEFNIENSPETHSILTGLGTSGKGFNFSSGGERLVHFSGHKEHQIGMIGEVIAKKALEQEYGADNVFWVSENAFLAANNPEGEAGKGYDFRVIDKKGKERLVEVKVLSSPEKGFKMTQNEWQTAIDESERYDLFLIFGVQTESEKLIYLKGFFKLGKNESLFKNERFSVESDRFLVKFRM